jgi:hypothetical protein
MMITDEWYVAKAEAGLYKTSAAETAAALRHLCGVGLSADQEVFAVFAGLDLRTEPQRHAPASGPDFVGVLRIAVLHGDGAGLAASAAAAVSVPADFQKLRELRLQLLTSRCDLAGNHGLDFSAQALKLTRRHLL